MSLLIFAPLALFGVLALTAVIVSFAIERAERRRARLFSPRRPRAWRFRPVVIEGGKAGDASPAEQPPEDARPAAKTSSR